MSVSRLDVIIVSYINMEEVLMLYYAFKISILNENGANGILSFSVQC